MTRENRAPRAATIIVGVDGSGAALKVLTEAARLARAFDARLTILRATEVPTGLAAEPTELHPRGLSGLLLESARKELTALVAREVPAELVAECEVVLGTPWSVLCDAAVALEADYLVVGSHGYSLLDRALGPTAARVCSFAPCPVVVVR